MGKDNLVEITGLITQRAEAAKLHERKARAWRRYSEDFGEKCDLADRGLIDFEVIQRRGVEAIRFGLDNIWHVNIPQYGSGKPTPAS